MRKKLHSALTQHKKIGVVVQRSHSALNSKRNLYCLSIAFVFITLISGASVCASSSEQKTVTLFVAAGMKKPMDALIEKYKTEKGVEAIPNYGSSGQLWA